MTAAGPGNRTGSASAPAPTALPLRTLPVGPHPAGSDAPHVQARRTHTTHYPGPWHRTLCGIALTDPAPTTRPVTCRNCLTRAQRPTRTPARANRRQPKPPRLLEDTA
jgi:hypothetical protein